MKKIDVQSQQIIEKLMSELTKHRKLMSNVRFLVCVALFYQTNIGESLCTVAGLHRERAKGDAPTIRDHQRPNLTLSPLR